MFYFLAMDTGTYFYCWKTTFTVSRIKYGVRNDKNNNWRINIISAFFRIVKKSAGDELPNFLLTEKLISDS